MSAKDFDTAIVWLRRDLRLADNPALAAAIERAKRVIVTYIWAPEEDGAWAATGASRWWLHHSLQALQHDIKQRGGLFVLRQGSSLTVLRQLVAETGAGVVTWNRLYDPASRARDTAVEAALTAERIACNTFNAALLFEPWEIKTAGDTPFKVFTAFWRQCGTRLDKVSTPQPPPEKWSLLKTATPHSETLNDFNLLEKKPWEQTLRANWKPGEIGAHAALAEFSSEALASYATGRDRPDLSGTSKLSPHLHLGEIGPRQVLAQLYSNQERDGSAQKFLAEIGWREFAHYLLYHFPWTAEKPLDTRFVAYPWQSNNSALQAWQHGRTGVPIVDAGMRELWNTGWMHNRVRMIVASFLTKNLRIHWLEGARWFWNTLVDADLANNTLGWQWTAGCGADAAPYFRVFNPVLQAQRFDPQRAYIRRWIPELAALPDRWIHHPWLAPAPVLAAAGIVLGKTYLTPIVDLATSRAQALMGYDEMRISTTY